MREVVPLLDGRRDRRAVLQGLLGVDGVKRAHVLDGQLDLLGCTSVEFADCVHDVDGLEVAALDEEELGRLAEVEDDESDEEEAEREGADGECRVPPAVVLGLGAARLSRRHVSAEGGVNVASSGRLSGHATPSASERAD